MTYISLFSSAGIGCYGFKKEGFECIDTCELLKPRLEIQRANNKCKYASGYIAGDLTTDTVKQQLFNEVERWRSNDGLEKVDVVIATPPCQGMSSDLNQIWNFSGKDIFATISDKTAFTIENDSIKLYDFEDNFYELDFNGKLITEIIAAD